MAWMKTRHALKSGGYWPAPAQSGLRGWASPAAGATPPQAQSPRNPFSGLGHSIGAMFGVGRPPRGLQPPVPPTATPPGLMPSPPRDPSDARIMPVGPGISGPEMPSPGNPPPPGFATWDEYYASLLPPGQSNRRPGAPDVEPRGDGIRPPRIWSPGPIVPPSMPVMPPTIGSLGKMAQESVYDEDYGPR
jgi:hypothetical protein